MKLISVPLPSKEEFHTSWWGQIPRLVRNQALVLNRAGLKNLRNFHYLFHFLLADAVRSEIDREIAPAHVRRDSMGSEDDAFLGAVISLMKGDEDRNSM